MDTNDDAMTTNKKGKPHPHFNMFVARTIIKKILGVIFVIGYYGLINLHMYYFIYYFINRVAFNTYSKPVAIVRLLTFLIPFP